MPVSNMNTQQTPITTGKTGTQVVKLIPAPRVYVKAADLTKSPFTATAFPIETLYLKTTNGVLPSTGGYAGFVDLGVVDAMAKVTYSKTTEEIRTGFDQILRSTFVKQKTASIEFNLWQVDDVILEQMQGVSASVISSNNIVNFQLGQEDLVQLQLMLVVTSKLDGKEFQMFNPAAYIRFEFTDLNNGLALKCTGDLTAFRVSGASADTLMSTTIFK